MKPAISNDPLTGRSLAPWNDALPTASYFELLAVDSDEALPTARRVVLAPRQRFTKRQRRMMEYDRERQKAKAAFDAQCAREDAATEAYLANARETLRKAGEAENAEKVKAAELNDVLVAEYERTIFKYLRGGRGFRRKLWES